MRATLALLILVAPDASAGAWARGDGEVFVSTKHVATTERAAIEARLAGAQELSFQGYSTIYAEFGLSDRLTVGFDYGIANDLDFWTGLIFVRRTFDTGGRNVWAIELAGGPRGLFETEIEGVVRPSLQWGRGTDWGWLAVEGYAEFLSDSNDMAYKLDATAGWRQDDRTSWIAQVQAADYPGIDPTVRLAPSYVRRLGDRMSVELGVVADVAGRDQVGLSLGTWLEF